MGRCGDARPETPHREPKSSCSSGFPRFLSRRGTQTSRVAAPNLSQPQGCFQDASRSRLLDATGAPSPRFAPSTTTVPGANVPGAEGLLGHPPRQACAAAALIIAVARRVRGQQNLGNAACLSLCLLQKRNIMSRNKHHTLYYYRRLYGSLRATAINRMDRRVPLRPERLRGLTRDAGSFCPCPGCRGGTPRLNGTGGPGSVVVDADSAPCAGYSRAQTGCKAFPRLGHGAGSPSPVRGFITACWAQLLACPQLGWPHTPPRDCRTPSGMDGDVRGPMGQHRGAQPHPAGGGGHVLCTGTFGVPGRVWHLGAHLDVFRVEHPRAGRARLGGMGPCCAGSLGERVPGQAGCPAALHVPSPAERSIAMTTLLKNSDRRLVWGFLLRAHLQTLLACQLLCWGFPGIPSCGRGAGLGMGQSSARGGVWGSLMLPVAPHALFSPQKYFPAAKRFSIPAFPTTAGT